MEQDLSQLLATLPQYERAVHAMNEIILANLVLLSEIPAPTFEEAERRQFVLDRFSEFELDNVSTDQIGNALGIIKGSGGERSILVVAHLDTPFDRSIDHTVSVSPNTIAGAGVGDDSVGLAALVSLPLLLRQLGLTLKSDLILMASVRSLGRGDIEGLRFFLDNRSMAISSGVCVEGVQLGRLSYASIGMLRGEIQYRIPAEYDWTRFGAGGAIVNITDVINRILELPLPRRPRTSIVFNRIEAGGPFNTTPSEVTLQFEVRSESEAIVRRIERDLANITAETASQTGADVELSVLSRRRPGGLPFADPLAALAREIMTTLGVQPRITPSTSELSAFIDQHIPAVTIGLTVGEHYNEEHERLEIEPIGKGLAQLVGLLVAMDGGLTDEPERVA